MFEIISKITLQHQSSKYSQSLRVCRDKYIYLSKNGNYSKWYSRYKVTYIDKLIKDRWNSGNKFTDDEMAAIMGSIFRCLHYIHSMNIIHRDIKPQNILIPCYDDFSKLKMADFGLSTKLDFFYPKTATSKCGTMLFMAP